MAKNTQTIPEDMHWTGHLGELRKRLFISLGVFIVFFGLGFYFAKDIYFYVEGDVPFQLTILSPFEIIWVYIMIATMAGLIITLPFLGLQLWLFISPGLTKKERKVSLLYIPAMFLLFVLGLGFGFFFIKDLILQFLLDLSEGVVQEMYTARNYFKFIMQTTIPFAFFFEVPLIAMFLTSLGILDPKVMKKTRKYAYLILVILGAMLSPPDFVLQLLVAGPLILLYEIAIFMSGIVYRRRMRHLKSLYTDTDE